MISFQRVEEKGEGQGEQEESGERERERVRACQQYLSEHMLSVTVVSFHVACSLLKKRQGPCRFSQSHHNSPTRASFNPGMSVLTVSRQAREVAHLAFSLFGFQLFVALERLLTHIPGKYGGHKVPGKAWDWVSEEEEYSAQPAAGSLAGDWDTSWVHPGEPATCG